ncbi:MAG: RimK family protein [Opitutales bacterium]|nr:RimK family protein [Opitutales bacterium]
MNPFLLVVDNPDRWPIDVPGVRVVAARTYLSDPAFVENRRFKVLNMCRSYRYQSVGYYVSLLAGARGHRPVPSVSTILDLKSQSIIRSVSADLEDTIRHSLQPLQSDKFTLSIYFARNMAKRHDRLSRALFNLFPAPLLRAHFRREGEDGPWSLINISPIASSDIPEDHRSFVREAATAYFSRPVFARKSRKAYRFDLAILVDPREATPPSNERALRLFEKAAENLGIATELITAEDYGRLSEFDGLFIRRTTSVDNYTYRFARKAEAENLVVIDDPLSILRCGNKVFLAEVLNRHHITTPRTLIIHRDNVAAAPGYLGLPLILKQPDSSFSQGVVKAKDADEYKRLIAELLDDSEMVIGQEFLPTPFDWRVGVLEGKALYVCQYFMARGHWQIYNHDKKGRDFTGNATTLPLDKAPPAIVETAVKAANCFGNGLYGVDLKEVNGRTVVIEVNDNPTVDHGIEDEVLQNQLYEAIMRCFLRRMEAKREAR